jgi:hypothetical protein
MGRVSKGAPPCRTNQSELLPRWASILARIRSTSSASIDAARSCCGRSGRAGKWKRGSPSIGLRGHFLELRYGDCTGGLPQGRRGARPFVARLHPLIQLETTTVEDDQLPPEMLIRDVPSWAFDMYSREGRRRLCRHCCKEPARPHGGCAPTFRSKGALASSAGSCSASRVAWCGHACTGQPPTSCEGWSI